MEEIINILKRADNVTTSPQQVGYSMVRIHAGTDDNNEEIIYEAGNDTGAVLEISNEFGTQQMAEDILAEIAGLQYQPGKADGALVDPAAEIGDAITANNAYFGLYIRATEFGKLMKSDVEAPTDQEIEHEFGAETSAEREYIRFTGQVKSTLRVHAAEIEAKVSVESRNAQTGFGWSLLNNEWKVGTYHGNTLNPVLTVNAEGVTIKGSGTFTGTITATGGTIGGLTINQDGSIQSANGNFKVDALGNLTATSGTFSGAVYASNIKSDAINGYGGYFNGGGISSGSIAGGKIVPYDITTAQTSGGINTSLGYANFSNAVFNRLDTAPYVEAGGIYSGFYFVNQGGAYYSMSMHTHTFSESSGKITIGGADWTGAAHSFNIADTQAYRDGVSAAAPSYITYTSNYNSATHKYYITVDVHDGTGATALSKRIETGTNAYDAGYSAGRSSVTPHYAVFEVRASSPSGAYVYIYSSETGLMRLYEGDTFDQT